MTPAATARRRTARALAWHAGALALLAVILDPVVCWSGPRSSRATRSSAASNRCPADPRHRRHPVSTFFTNSLVPAVGSVAGVLISCSPAAYAFARIRFAGRNLLFAVMASTLLLPFQCASSRSTRSSRNSI